MSRNPVLIGPETPVPRALRVARVAGIRHLLVVRHGELLGVLCECELWRASEDESVVSRMARPITISAVSPAPLARALMIHNDVDCLPVLRDECLVGVVTRRDLLEVGYPVPVRTCGLCGASRHVRDVPELGLGACYDCRVGAPDRSSRKEQLPHVPTAQADR